jgi:hypothetical protein
MSDTPRTDEQALIDSASYDGYSEDYASLLNFTRELERELNELKARHKTAILECTKYTPESWAAACEHEEPCAVWLDGPQMTQLMKDKEKTQMSIFTGLSHGKTSTKQSRQKFLTNTKPTILCTQSEQNYTSGLEPLNSI